MPELDQEMNGDDMGDSRNETDFYTVFQVWLHEDGNTIDARAMIHDEFGACDWARAKRDEYGGPEPCLYIVTSPGGDILAIFKANGVKR